MLGVDFCLLGVDFCLLGVDLCLDFLDLADGLVELLVELLVLRGDGVELCLGGGKLGIELGTGGVQFSLTLVELRAALGDAAIDLGRRGFFRLLPCGGHAGLELGDGGLERFGCEVLEGECCGDGGDAVVHGAKLGLDLGELRLSLRELCVELLDLALDLGELGLEVICGKAQFLELGDPLLERVPCGLEFALALFELVYGGFKLALCFLELRLGIDERVVVLFGLDEGVARGDELLVLVALLKGGSRGGLCLLDGLIAGRGVFELRSAGVDFCLGLGKLVERGRLLLRELAAAGFDLGNGVVDGLLSLGELVFGLGELVVGGLLGIVDAGVGVVANLRVARGLALCLDALGFACHAAHDVLVLLGEAGEFGGVGGTQVDDGVGLCGSGARGYEEAVLRAGGAE